MKRLPVLLLCISTMVYAMQEPNDCITDDDYETFEKVLDVRDIVKKAFYECVYFDDMKDPFYCDKRDFYDQFCDELIPDKGQLDQGIAVLHDGTFGIPSCVLTPWGTYKFLDNIVVRWGWAVGMLVKRSLQPLKDQEQDFYTVSISGVKPVKRDPESFLSNEQAQLQWKSMLTEYKRKKKTTLKKRIRS